MKRHPLKFWLVNGTALGVLLSSYPTAAQIVPDATLPVNSVVTQQGNTSVITGGTTRGTNLFHSFDSFSVPTGGTAHFNNAVGIQNILSRVTGGSISNIDGLIRANGSANLFLLNPNGIIFGSNARLNIGGSFLASTASSFLFADGTVFSTTPATPTTPLLTISVPVGLQYGSNPGSVRVQSSSLEVSSGQTLALVGGNVSLEGGQLLAPGGRVELAGVAGNGNVGLSTNGSTLSLSFPAGVPQTDVSLTNGAEVNVRAGGGGSIGINARNLNMAGGSNLRAGINSGLGSVNSQAGDIEVNAQGAINLEDSSIISNQVRSNAVGNGGDIRITTDSLRVTNGSQVTASTSGQGNAGSVTIAAGDTVSFDGKSYVFSSVTSQGIGNAGDINITTGSLFLTNGAELVAATFARGNAGSVNITARDTVSFDGVGSNGFPSGVFSNVAPGGAGTSQNINITTGSLFLTNGAELVAATFARGNAGSVNITARDTVSLDGVGSNGFPSGVFSSVNSGAVGNGGDINITTGSLRVTDGSKIIASTFGQGNAGSVTITARDTVSFDGVSSNGRYSGAASSVEGRGIGNAGDINITTGSLFLTNGAELVAATFARGNAGSVNITARDTVSLDGVGSNGFPSGVFSNVAPGGAGTSQNINITTGSLFLTNGAVLVAATFAQGDAGSVNITARDTVSLDGVGSNGFPSGVFSSVNSGAVGNSNDINITTGLLSVTNGAQLRASSSGNGAAGGIKIEAESIRLDNGATFSADTSGGGGNINLRSRDLILRRGSSITTNATGSKITGGNITIDTDNLVAFPKENSDISANSENSFGGRVIVNAQGIFGTQFRPRPTELSDITASSELGAQFNGIVQLNTPDIDPNRGLATLPTNVIDTSGLIANSCIGRSNRREGKFIITRNGGLPVMPDAPLVAPYQTYQIPTVESAGVSRSREQGGDRSFSTNSSNSTLPTASPLVEATGWKYGAHGEVILVAQAPTVAPGSSWSKLPTCKD